MKILVIDVGGTHIKVLATGQTEQREVASDKSTTAADMVEAVWPSTKLSPVFAQIDAPDIAWVARLGSRAELAHEMPKPVYLRAPDAKPPQPSGLVGP